MSSFSPYHRPNSPPAPRNDRRRVWLWLIFLIPMGLVATVGFIVALGIVFNMTGEVETPTEEEEALVLNIDHVTGWMADYRPDLARETLTKTRYVDSSYEIEYTYDVPEDEGAPYLSYTLTFEPNATDATTTYASYWGGTQVAFFMFGSAEVTVEENNELFSWGDQSRFGILTSEGAPFGNVFVARKDSLVVYFILSGIYFDDPDEIGALLEPYLAKLQGYEAAANR